ncbi:MAG: DNA polymerase III subunit alpha [Bacteroidales bacterium]|nr:DNA polymerase III subunit alpha [Bacteroidales bacterium]MCF8387290.1 DNA polymerase III subunit alpha [Bacteroidales bacterium]MCF8398724.1 DNA polymerase III subunit alpha [Bacteroidales bacterium]
MILKSHSYYSLRYGTMSIDELVNENLKHGFEGQLMADINNSTGILDFVKACKKKSVKPLAGIDFRNKDQRLFTGIAKNNAGFQELNEYLSYHNLSKQKLPAISPDFDHAILVYPFGTKSLRDLKENEYIGIKRNQLNKLYTSEFRNATDRLIMWQPVTFRDEKAYYLHRNLRAIDHNTLITKLRPEQIAPENEHFVSKEELSKAYRDYPGIIRNTEKLIGECNIDFEYKSIKNKATYTGSKYEDKLLLERLCREGLAYRYGEKHDEARRRVDHELEVIHQLGFSAYFLITWDIISWSMSQGIYHVGRGSGANSIVAYCLKITDVDPIELDLYFERFINPHRSSPPDFDIDYSWKDRDAVHDYIFRKFSREHTALLGTITTFKGKSIYRELGKVYGLPKAEIDDLANEPHKHIHDNHINQTIYSFAQMMIDFPNIRSIHAGGVLISERPINYYSALDLPPKGLPTVQWDMYVAEDIGFEKLDILSQRGIGHINEAVEIIRENRGEKVDVHQVKKFKSDPQVKMQLKTAETNGCFYIESPAMRGLLRKLRCDNYISLVAASSIIRPGVAKSGMMREYIQRFHYPEGFDYLHPVMEEQLKETYGVMVYQEDVIKICHHYAGLDLADADILRRAMSGKYRNKEEFQRIVDRFFEYSRKKGRPEETTKEIWRQIESFAGYSFSKAHSASYAVESFQSLYLKAHYPLEFMTAVINNFGGFYHSWVYFNEARRQGAKIMLPSVNKSHYKSRIDGDTIYIGFVHIADLENKIGHLISEERALRGDFKSLEDFVKRVPTGIEQLIILIRTGAFAFTGKEKAHLLWEAHMMLSKDKKQGKNHELFFSPARRFKLPQLAYNKIEDAYDEIEYLGFPVTLTYFDLLETRFRGEAEANQLNDYLGKSIRMLGLLVTIKKVITVKKEWMAFGTFVDQKGEFFDCTHFSQSLQRYPFQGYGVYLIKGKVVEEFGYATIEVEKMAKLPIRQDPRGE